MNKGMTLEETNYHYQIICSDFAIKFALKQELTFDNWCSEAGQIYSFNNNDFFFDLHDIIYDLNSDQPTGLIINYHIHLNELHNKEITYREFCNQT
jgi:hypothetical protein